mgnify:CR=1 FL=1
MIQFLISDRRTSFLGVYPCSIGKATVLVIDIDWIHPHKLLIIILVADETIASLTTPMLNLRLLRIWPTYWPGHEGKKTGQDFGLKKKRLFSIHNYWTWYCRFSYSFPIAYIAYITTMIIHVIVLPKKLTCFAWWPGSHLDDFQLSIF